MAGAPDQPDDRPTLFTVGHSTRSLDELVELLEAHDVEAVADVRAIPKSRRHPHFHHESLAVELPRRGIAYLPFITLGGRRRSAGPSINTGWRHASFQAYADYMQTPEFRAALAELMAEALQRPTATMCSEAVPWRCHRRLISDALLVRGWRVLDIMSPTKASEHKLTPFARVQGLEVTYPDPEGPALFEGQPVSPPDSSPGSRSA